MTEQLTQADVDRLWANRKHDEINAAREAGRLDVLLGVPAEDIALLGRARSGRIDGADVEALNRLRRYDLVELARAESRITYTNKESNA